jgi:hypothetical protein
MRIGPSQRLPHFAAAALVAAVSTASMWITVLTSPAPARAEDSPKKEELRKALKDLDLVGEWIYDDLDAGLAKARASGKPVLAVFR